MNKTERSVDVLVYRFRPLKYLVRSLIHRTIFINIYMLVYICYYYLHYSAASFRFLDLNHGWIHVRLYDFVKH